MNINIIQTVESICRQNNVKSVLLFYSPLAPMLQERTDFSDFENSIIDNALQRRKQAWFPFWDAIILECYYKTHYSPNIFRSTRYHQTAKNIVEVTVNSLFTSNLTKLITNTPDKHILVISSRVRLHNGETAHIPMLDFSISKGEKELNLLESVVKNIWTQNGYIVDSGNKSYHYYGAETISEEELPKFLGKAILFTPIVDKMWAAHQLIESACGLRISSKSQESSSLPFVVRKIEN